MIFPDLTSPDGLKAYLAQHKIAPSRSLGQNFLISAEVVEATVATAAEGPRHVTELGPGAGALTQGLLGAGFQVRAIEKDDDFARLLPGVVPKKYRDALEVIHGDLKEADWMWPSHYQLVGNIPYNLSGLIIRRITQLDPPPVQAVLLVQREVGERMTAQPPHMSLLSLAIQLWGEAHAIMNVPASCFYPPPKVQSQLVLLQGREDAPPLDERESVMAVARIFFQQKRKQIGGVMRRNFDMEEAGVAAAAIAAEVTPDMRPQELEVAQWLSLAKLLPQLRP